MPRTRQILTQKSPPFPPYLTARQAEPPSKTKLQKGMETESMGDPVKEYLAKAHGGAEPGTLLQSIDIFEMRAW